MLKYAVFLPALAFAAVVDAATQTHSALTTDELEWKAAPPALPEGARVAILEGDPARPGPFTLRLRMPLAYRIPPHWHPGIEHVTVLQGRLNLGLGKEMDLDRTRGLPQGSFFVMPPGHVHYVWVTLDDTIVQLHGVGPWGITYVNPADDPRSRPGRRR